MKTIDSLEEHFRTTEEVTALATGSFNPIHLRHIELIRTAVTATASQEAQHVLVFPNSLDYRKLRESLEDRIRWVRLGIEECAPDLVDKVTIVNDPDMAQDLNAFTDLLEANHERIIRVVGSDKRHDVASLQGRIPTVRLDRTKVSSTDIRSRIRQGDTEGLQIPQSVLKDILERNKFDSRSFALRKVPTNLPRTYLDVAVSQIIEEQTEAAKKYPVRVLGRDAIEDIIRRGDMYHFVDDCGIFCSFYFKYCGVSGGTPVYKGGGLIVSPDKKDLVKANSEKLFELMVSTYRESHPNTVVIVRTHSGVHKYMKRFFQEDLGVADFRKKYPEIFSLYTRGEENEGVERDTRRMLINYYGEI